MWIAFGASKETRKEWTWCVGRTQAVSPVEKRKGVWNMIGVIDGISGKVIYSVVIVRCELESIPFWISSRLAARMKDERCAWPSDGRRQSSK